MIINIMASSLKIDLLHKNAHLKTGEIQANLPSHISNYGLS